MPEPHPQAAAVQAGRGSARTPTPTQLVEAINHRYDQMNSLTATVDFAASVGGAAQGQADGLHLHPRVSFSFANRKMLRVLGLVPVLHTHLFDLASDGSTFTLLIPPRSRAIIGSNSVTTQSRPIRWRICVRTSSCNPS